MTPPKDDKLYEAHEYRIANLETLMQTMTSSVVELQTKAKERSTIDVSTQLFFPPFLVVKIVGTAIVVAFIVGAGQWFAATYSMSGVKDTLNEMKSDARDAATRTELAIKETRYEQAKQTGHQEAQDKEIQALKDKVKR